MLTIAKIPLASPFILAPLAGYSDLPFRLLCRRFGAGLTVSEMISCHGLTYQQHKTLKMLATTEEDSPLSLQIFGADIDIMAEAADQLNRYHPDFVDINMGCPAKKVTKKGAGAALMASPVVASNIIQEVVKNSQAPVTVKFRKGVDNSSINCIDFAKMAEDAGAAAITVHGRTWSQGFSGYADWDIIAKVKQAVSIPVIGNGDIETHREATDRLRTSGCDGIMIGRAALGNPWIFSNEKQPQNYVIILQTVMQHLDLMQQHLDVERLLAAIKNHIGRYFNNLPGSGDMRKTVFNSKSFASLYSTILELTNSLEVAAEIAPDKT